MAQIPIHIQTFDLFYSHDPDGDSCESKSETEYKFLLFFKSKSANQND